MSHETGLPSTVAVAVAILTAVGSVSAHAAPAPNTKQCIAIVRRIDELSEVIDLRPDGPTKADREKVDSLISTVRHEKDLAQIAMLLRVLPWPEYDPLRGNAVGFWACINKISRIPGDGARQALLDIGDQINFRGETEMFEFALRNQWRLTHPRGPVSRDVLWNREMVRERQLKLR